MHRAFVGDLQQLATLRIIEISLQREHPLDPVDVTVARFALRAVGRVDFAVVEIDAHPLEWNRLAIGIHTNRHRGTRAERSRKQVIRART
jgi:hypothetical protein